MTSDVDVAIVGGGLSGLSTGLALQLAGHRVTVLDPRPLAARDAWGLVLWPPGTRILADLGALDDVLDRGTTVGTIRLSDPRGDDWINVDTRRLGVGVFAGVLPSRLDDVLRSHAVKAGVTVVQGAGPVTPARHGRGWRITAHGAEPRTVTARLLVAADGPGSPVRDLLGIKADRWRPRDQVVRTGIGGPLPVAESCQVLGNGWSAGHAALGDRTWIYTITRPGGAASAAEVAARQLPAPGVAAACAGLARVDEVRPWRVRADRWATDGAILIGDAAHGMLPYFGLGGTLSLEDVTVVVEVVGAALRRDELGAQRLGAFRAARIRRISYAQRLSSIFAMALTRDFPGLRSVRNQQLRHVARNGELMQEYFRSLALSTVPPLRTRLQLGLP